MYYYFELRSQFYPREKNQSLIISLSEIQNLWNIALKNVKYRLNKLIEEEYIKFQPGQGRGNISKIEYCKDYQQDVIDYIMTSRKSESYGKIFELFDLPIPRDWITSSIANSREMEKKLETYCVSSIKYNINLEALFSINPFLLENQHEAAILTYLGDTLIVYDEISQNTKPNIVHHWEISDSYKKWIFHLRKGIKFHNNLELNASDVIWSLKQYKKRQRSPSWVFNSICKIDLISNYKFIIELKFPIYCLDRYLAWPNLIICQENTGLENQLPIMSGKFKLLTKSESQIILESNKHYFQGQALIDKVEINDTNAYKGGSNIAIMNFKTKKSNYRKILHSGVCMLCFNFRRDTIIHNKYFREAILYILDFQKMKAYFQENLFEEATTFFSYYKKKIKKQNRNIKKLLDQSGYKGEQLTIHFFSPLICGSSDGNFIEYFVKSAKQNGIHLCIKRLSFESYFDGESIAQADMFYGANTPFGDYWASFNALFQDRHCLPSSFLSNNHLSYIKNILEINPNSITNKELEEKIETVEDFIRSNNLIILLFHRYLELEIPNQLKEFNMGQLGHPLIKDMWLDE
ncbi:MAG: hypothetical protein GY756_28085 [bacterium]|nr:hypothetical protein [bacterium]